MPSVAAAMEEVGQVLVDPWGLLLLGIVDPSQGWEQVAPVLQALLVALVVEEEEALLGAVVLQEH
jgi:hypothetical protein